MKTHTHHTDISDPTLPQILVAAIMLLNDPDGDGGPSSENSDTDTYLEVRRGRSIRLVSPADRCAEF